MTGGLFGRTPIGAVAVVEPPVSQWYARRARVAALAVGLACDAVATSMLSVFCPVLLAVALGVVAGLVCGLVAGVLVRIWPVLRVLWWWSVEIAAAVFVVAGPVALARATRPWLALAAVLLVAVGCGLVRPVRYRLAAWSWCLLVRHRLRVCFARLIRPTGSGSSRQGGGFPLVLWARSTPAGERVWLWLRPGLELADLDGKTGQIAVTCWADQVRVARASQRYAALVRVDVVRRDPLSGVVPSPLARLVPRLHHSDAPVSPAVSLVGLDLADVPEPAPESPRGGRR